jgi:hypothetical protein
MEVTIIQCGDPGRLETLRKGDHRGIGNTKREPAVLLHEFGHAGKVVPRGEYLGEVLCGHGLDEVDLCVGADVLSEQIAGFSEHIWRDQQCAIVGVGVWREML